MGNFPEPEERIGPPVENSVKSSWPAASLVHQSAASGSQPPAVMEDLSFWQMDGTAQAKLFYGMSRSFEDLVPTAIDRPLHTIMRRSFPIPILYMLLILIASVVAEFFLRPTLVFGVLLVVSLVSVSLSIAAGVTYTILAAELRAKLSALEATGHRQIFGQHRAQGLGDAEERQSEKGSKALLKGKPCS